MSRREYASYPGAGEGAITSGDVTVTGGVSKVTAISGASPINITPSVLQWTAATVTPTLTHAALASTSAGSGAAGQGMSVTAQAGQAATGAGNNGGAGANLILSGGAGGTSGSATAGAPGFVQVNSAGTGVAWLGAAVGSPTFGALWLGNATPTTTNFALYGNNTTTAVTAPSNVILQANSVTGLSVSTTLIGLAKPLGGFATGAVPFSFSGQTSPNTVACGTGGTQTISAAQAIIPFFLVTTGTLTSNAIVDFSTNASTGHFICDLSGVGTLGAFSLQFKNGTGVISITATALTNLLATGANGVEIYTYGTNNITLI